MTASEHVGIRTLFTSFRKQLSLETINTRKFLLYSNVLDELAPPEIGSRGAIVKERPASFATRAGHARSKGGMNAYILMVCCCCSTQRAHSPDPKHEGLYRYGRFRGVSV